MSTNELLTISGFLFTLLITIVAWIGNGMVEQLKNIASSVHRIENELSVLTNDHNNVKDDVRDVKEDMKKIKERLSFLER